MQEEGEGSHCVCGKGGNRSDLGGKRGDKSDGGMYPLPYLSGGGGSDDGRGDKPSGATTARGGKEGNSGRPSREVKCELAGWNGG